MKKFKVLLVYCNLQMVNLLPSSVALLSACLKKEDIDVRLFDTTLYKTAEKSVDEERVELMQLRPFNLKEKGVDYKENDAFSDFQELVKTYDPDVIGVSMTDATYDLGKELISRLGSVNSHVIFGGVCPTFDPDRAIKETCVDSICIGEGEKALVELCVNLRDGKDITRIKNLWVKRDGKVYKNPMREVADLDGLPDEDFSIFEEKRIFRPMQGKIFRMVPICIDRGCPYTCTFCAAPSWKKLYRDAGCGRYFRVKTPERVMAELKRQIDKYKADYIYFSSETFFARDDKNIEEFAEQYAKEIGLPFWCQTRVETLTEKHIKILERMNCDRMSIGIEHGNEEFRKKILKKHFTNDQAIEVFRLLEKSRIAVTVNNIIGFPDETRELAFDTIRLNRSIKADSINALYFTPFTGTPLRQYCIDKGYLDPDTPVKGVAMNTVLKMPQFSASQIRGLVRTFPLYIKMPESYFPEIQVAEQLNEEGDEVLAKLREIYFREYFK